MLDPNSKMTFKDYSSTIKTCIAVSSTFIILLGFSFIPTLIGYVKVSAPFTALISVFFILVGILGLISLLVDSVAFKTFVSLTFKIIDKTSN